MKFRKLIFLSAVLLAVGSSFAFTKAKKFEQIAYFSDDTDPQCYSTYLEDDSCSPSNYDTICTVEDYNLPGHPQVTAYATLEVDGVHCYNPYRLPY